jgi:diguanylate cyclase (GGDEF)-like protein
MFADLDQFKLINDSMGHAVGDELLIVAATRLQSAVREHDVVARISGDEFLIICDQIDTQQAHYLAERIRSSFTDAFELTAGKLFVTTSIGVAVTGVHNLDDGPSLMRDADTAMYRSKLAGRNAVKFFDVEMRERVERRVHLERQMRAALDTGVIVPFFQPLVTLPEGQVEGFEALARWPRHEGSIPPAEFIPVAEESGLIIALGASILDQACMHLAEWRRTLPGAENAYVAVNMSTRQILDAEMVQTVASVLDRWNLPGEALWLEITESVMIEDTAETQQVLNAICGLGVRLSVDDFGTGYSSLSYLKKYPISKVKIDKSFVDGLDEADADHSLVAAIIAMAAALDLTTTAEGVERARQADRLFELGCVSAQGYRFARAVPAADVAATVRELGFAPHRTVSGAV